jgi:DNA processing protein
MRALEQRRPVMAVPGPVTSTQSARPHLLIHDHGARLITNPADIAEHLGLG